MPVKYVFVTGGVVSGLGKGITAASLGRLLKARGYKVTMQKFDPYINIDPGTMNPIQHGEVFVTDDGAETDLDLGHYERFIDESLTKNSNVTTGKVYWSVLQKERHGDFGGGTVQVIPHITNEIKSRFYRAKSPEENKIAIIEVGGTVGDIESQPFLEAIRQFQLNVGHDNAILIHVTLIPYLKASEELKTKPTQASVKELQGMGIQPDVLVCRSEHELTEDIKEKIALFCNVPVSHVLQNLDVEYLYEAPLAMEREKLADVVLSSLRLENRKPDLSDWEEMVESLRNPNKTVKIAIVGKYTQLHDAYLSVVEALKHGGISCRAKVELDWIDSEELTEKNLDQQLHNVDGILVPGGFGNRGTEGMILAAQYARVHKIPYLGICLGMQMAIVEFARHVLGYEDANSIELNPTEEKKAIESYSEACVLAAANEIDKNISIFKIKNIQPKYLYKLADYTIATLGLSAVIVFDEVNLPGYEDMMIGIAVDKTEARNLADIMECATGSKGIDLYRKGYIGTVIDKACYEAYKNMVMKAA